MEKENQKTSLTTEELSEVLQFSQALYGFPFGGIFTPYNQNQNLLELNNNPAKPTYKKLVEALESVPYDYGSLASYSEFMEIWDSIYSNTFKYLEGLLAFDLSYTCVNIKNPSEYKSEEYKKDLKRVNKFLDNFDYKLEFKKIVKELLRKETSFVWFRDTEDLNSIIDIEDDNKPKKLEKFSLQIMPQKYCMLTGYFNSSQLLYDFNINYFLNPSVDINLFAPKLKKEFKTYMENKGEDYVPSSPLYDRDGIFSTWVQCSPNDGAYAFKFDLSNFRQVPPFANLIKSCINNDEVQALQADKDMISAYLLLAGEIKTMSTEKSGNKPNQFAISPQVMGQFMQLVTSGVKNNCRPMALPLENIRGWQFNDTNPNMVSNKLSSTSAQSVSASSMIYNTSKMAQFEFENAIYSDYCFMKELYEQFNLFLDFYVNKKTAKYKFKFSFDGLDRYWDRENRMDAIKGYADKGIVLDPTMWASAIGMKPQDFMRSIECGHNSDFINNLTQLFGVSNNKNTNENEKMGTPMKKSNDLSEGGEISREYGK